MSESCVSRERNDLAHFGEGPAGGGSAGSGPGHKCITNSAASYGYKQDAAYLLSPPVEMEGVLRNLLDERLFENDLTERHAVRIRVSICPEHCRL